MEIKFQNHLVTQKILGQGITENPTKKIVQKPLFLFASKSYLCTVVFDSYLKLETQLETS
jgi:hypothetical protein